MAIELVERVYVLMVLENPSGKSYIRENIRLRVEVHDRAGLT